MLKRENYSSEHIDALRKQTGADPSILERTVFAFGLLEALCRVKMPFIFKGGTSLSSVAVKQLYYVGIPS